MRCHSVQVLWASTPPFHDVVAMVALMNPPSLWTGGSRGDIIYWKLPSCPSDSVASETELWPMAILCGHAAAIADLAACKLYEVKETGVCSGSSILGSNELSDPSGSSNACEVVLSACIEGWLCAWDSLTGRCRRRRRLPPWVGSPCLMTTLPSAQRYVCIACDGSNAVLSRNSSMNDGDNDIRRLVDHARSMALERSGSIKRNIRGAVVVVDSSTLSVLQVVYNGFLGIGPVKSIVVLPEGESPQRVMVSDAVGRIRVWSINQGKHGKHEAGSEWPEQATPTSHKAGARHFHSAQTVALSSDGEYVLLVFTLYWIILSTEDCSIVKESAHLEMQSKDEGNSFWAGGFFLVGTDKKVDRIKADGKASNFECMFMVWDTDGAAMLYSLQKDNTDQTFHMEDVCQIPPVAPNNGMKYNVKFCQLQDFLVCVGSSKAGFKAYSTPDTWVRLWHLPSKLFPYSEFQLSRVLLNGCHLENVLSVQELTDPSRKPVLCGQGGLGVHWLRLPFDNPTENRITSEEAKFELGHSQMKLDNATAIMKQDSSDQSGSSSGSFLVDKGKYVTASMLLFERSATPLTFVLGYNSGDIRLVELQALEASLLDSENGFAVDHVRNRYIVRCLTKHTGPIICLAEHSIPAETTAVNSGESNRRLLMSGSMDCSTCIWDLEKGGKLLVVHHYVTPVHQLLLPPPSTEPPWSNCFVTAGEDGCVALISLETLQVERMFIGHPVQPKVIAWDGFRGYLACLCASFPIQVTGTDALFIWDLKSGALERILRGAAAHSMFDNFLKKTQASSITNNLLPGRATSFSSLLHGDADSPPTQSGRSSPTDRFSGSGSKTSMEGIVVSGSNSLQVASGNVSPSHDAHLGEPTVATVESASKKVIGSLEKLSSRFTQVLNHGTKPIPSHLTEPFLGSNSSHSSSHRNLFHKQQPIKGACPFPGVAALQFDLFALMAPDLGRLAKNDRDIEKARTSSVSFEKTQGKSGTKATLDAQKSHSGDATKDSSDGIEKGSDLPSQVGGLEAKSDQPQVASSLGSFEGCLLRTSLSFLHLWGADLELDRLLEKELQIFQPKHVGVAAGFAGDRGAMTLLLPGWHPTFELWAISPEFCTLRSLTIVATALRMITLSRPTSNASSALAAFYTRGLAEKFPNVKAPSLELYACFWQDPSEHVRMAARSLFHCAASRAIPSFLCPENTLNSPSFLRESNNCESGINNRGSLLTVEQTLVNECSTEKRTWPESVSSSADIIEWLESFEGQDWTAVVGGTSQDARAVRIILGAALAVWYPGLVKPELAPSVAPFLVKLVKAVIDRHSAVAAELLADGMEGVWRHLISTETPQLISDIFLLIDCLSGGGSANPSFINNPATAMTIRETLTGSLLPSLAMADVPSFLKIVQIQLSVASADSPIHLVSLMAIIRIIRGAPRAVVLYLGQVTSIVLQTMNFGKHCFQTAMAAVREMVRVYPMVAVHQGSGKLAVGDAVGDVRSLAIQVYDLNSATKLKVLDASGPPGHPALLVNDGASTTIGGMSALIFSQDGEGLVAFSQHGLMIRWWSLGAVWWEKLSRVNAPVQCTKLVLVQPWAGFSPKSSRSSIMATLTSNSEMKDTSEEPKGHTNDDVVGRASTQNVDISFRLEWKHGKKIVLLHHGQELGVFQL